MGNRKSKLATAVIEKPTSNRNIVAEPAVVHAPVVVTEPVVTTMESAVVHEPVVVTGLVETIVSEPVVMTECTVTTADPVVHEPVVHEPVVHDPVVHDPVVHEPETVTESDVATELTPPTIDPESTAIIAPPVILESIPEVEEEQSARPTIKSDSSRSLKITFMSASHDPYAYLPKKEPETQSKHGKKFKKHQKYQKQVSAEKEEVAPSSTNMEEMD